MTGCQNNRQISRSRITSVRALTSTWLFSSSLPWWQALFVAAFLFTYFAVRKKQLCRDKLSRRISPILTDGYQVFRRSCSKQIQANGFISTMVVPASAESSVETTKNTGSVHTASTRGGRPLMQKWHRTLVALAISSVQTLTPAPVGLARAVVAEPRPTDTDSLMVFVRAGYGLSTAAKAAMNPELTADRPLTAASDMPTLALAAHEWKDRDSITKYGLWKKDERAEVHFGHSRTRTRYLRHSSSEERQAHCVCGHVGTIQQLSVLHVQQRYKERTPRPHRLHSSRTFPSRD